MKRTLLYNSSPVALNGGPRDNRLLRRWDAFSRLFQFGTEVTAVTAIAYNPYTGKLVFGFNSPAEDENYDDHRQLLSNLVLERLELIKSYFQKEGRTNKIWNVALKLGHNSRQTPNQPFEYSVVDIFTDLPEVYNTLYPPEDLREMLMHNKDYIKALLVQEGQNPDTAEDTYQRLLTNDTYRENHKFFRKDSTDRLFFSQEVSAAFAANQFEIAIEPPIQKPDKPASVHAEVAVANHILLTGSGSNEIERRRIPIGVSKLNCAHCANYFHMINQIANDAHDEAAINIPNFLVTGTHSCEFPNWGGVLPKWLLLNPPLTEIFRKYGLESLVTEAHESDVEHLNIKLRSPKKINTGIVPDTQKGSGAIRDCPLNSPLTHRSPPRTKFPVNKNTPERIIRDYQQLNNELRQKISEKTARKRLLWEEMQKIESINIKIATVTSHFLTQPASGKKTLSTAKMINELNLVLPLIEDPKTKQCIYDLITSTTLPDQISPSVNPYRNYMQIIGEDKDNLPALNVSAAEYHAVCAELVDLEQQQQASNAELIKINLSPNREQNNNNNNHSTATTAPSIQHPGFGQMLPPSVLQPPQTFNNNGNTVLQQWSFNPPSPPAPKLSKSKSHRKMPAPSF